MTPDELVTWERRLLAAFRLGYGACLDDLADAIGGRIMPAHPTQMHRIRWHLCCATCRRTGHRAGCTGCQERTRATFADPHPDDYEGRAA